MARSMAKLRTSSTTELTRVRLVLLIPRPPCNAKVSTQWVRSINPQTTRLTGTLSLVYMLPIRLHLVIQIWSRTQDILDATPIFNPSNSNMSTLTYSNSQLISVSAKIYHSCQETCLIHSFPFVLWNGLDATLQPWLERCISRRPSQFSQSHRCETSSRSLPVAHTKVCTERSSKHVSSAFHCNSLLVKRQLLCLKNILAKLTSL